jgi:hypothetical protein
MLANIKKYSSQEGLEFCMIRILFVAEEYVNPKINYLIFFPNPEAALSPSPNPAPN